MSIGLFSLCEATLAQCEIKAATKKTPSNRIAQALADRKLVAEPR